MRILLQAGWLLAGLLAAGFITVSVITAADTDAKTLFEKRCSLCHPTSRPLSKTKSGEQWRQTVTRMQTHAGGKISDAEAKIIVEYLTEIRGN